MAVFAKRALVLLLATTGTASHNSCDCAAECGQLLMEQREEIARLRAQIRALRSGTSPVAAAASPAARAPRARRAAANPAQAPRCDQNTAELKSNDNVAALHGCSAVQELWIHGASVSSLAGLENLVSVEGSLTIENTAQLSSLSGLENLTRVQGDVFIYENAQLRSLSGLGGLQTVEGSFTLRERLVHKLRSLEGLGKLTSVGGIVTVFNLGNLASLKGLGNLRSVGGLTVQYNDRLRSLEGLGNLAGMTGGVSVSSNRKLRSLEALGNLGGVEEDVFIWHNELLTSLHGFQNLTSVGGDVTLEGNDNLISLEGLQNIRSLGGGLTIKGHTQLPSLEGLRNLARVGGDVTVVGNWNLPSLHGLECLRTAASLRIVDNNILTSVSALKSLEFARGGVIIEACSLVSLYGLGTLDRAAELRVRRTQSIATCINRPSAPMQILGGPFAAGASVGAVYIDREFWPLCMTAQERMALVAAVLELGSSSIPEPRCARDLVIEPFTCTKGLPCNLSLAGFSIGGEVPASVFISGPTTGCGACPENHRRSNVTSVGLVDFGYALRDELAGLRSICLCGTPGDPRQRGPVGQLLLRGPRGSGATHCHRGRNCTVKLDGEALEPTDHVMLTSGSCSNGDTLPDIPTRWSAENEYLLHDAARWYTALPRTYHVCWRAPCSFTADGRACPAPEDRYFHAGIVELLGPYPNNQVLVLGQDNLTVANIGRGVADGDRIRLMRSCGEANEDGMDVLEARSSGLQFDFGALTEERVLAGSHKLCWCQEHNGTRCEAEQHFTAESGAVEILCPAGQEFVRSSRRCRECPAGRQRPKEGLEPCSECSTGQFATGGIGGCEACRAGAIAEVTGSAACVACQAWESADEAATGCSPDPLKLTLLIAFQLSVGAFCAVLVRTFLKRRLSVVDVSLERGCTVVTSLRPHGFSNFGRPSFPVTLRDTGHPGLDSPSQPLRVRVKDAARLELLTRKGDSISKTRLDTSMGTLEVPFPYDLYHQGWPVPAVVLMPGLLITVVVLSGLLLATDMAAAAFLGAAVIAGVSTAASVALRRRARATPLTQRLVEFKQALAPLLQTARCDKGSNRAIAVGRLHQLLEFFREFIRDRAAYYLVTNLLVPLTKETSLSYAEFVGPVQVEWFVSHFWGTAYEHFCTALQKHAESVCGEGDWKRTRYWVCFCSNNQHKLKDELGDGWHESSFYLTLRSGRCRGTCMVLDDEALPLTRVWCIFELMQTVKLQRSAEDFQGLLFCTSSGVLNTGSGSVEVALALAKRVANMNLETAKASSEHDATMIKQQVMREMGSFDALNRFVCDAIREMLMRARQNADGQFTTVLELLEPSAFPSV